MFSIRTTYPDRICYRPECDVHECHVLLPEGVRIAWQHVSSWGIRMELRRIAMRAPCHQGEGSLYLVHADGPLCGAPDISQPDGRGGRFNFPGQICPDPLAGYLTAGWERRTFQLLRSDISGSFNSSYSESFSLSIQCYGVLLKLPDISDQHLEIFCFRYLLSKSPNSPCNPPIIGFLSL